MCMVFLFNHSSGGSLCQVEDRWHRWKKNFFDIFLLLTQENGESVQPATGIFGFLHNPSGKLK